MPNWVFNYLSADGDEESIAQVKERLGRPVSYKIERMKFDEEKKEWVTGIEEMTWHKPVISFMNIVSPTDWDAYAKQQDRDNGIKLEDPDWWPKTVEWSKTQKDWYNWNTTNWGTKWDVAVGNDEEYPETELYEEEPRNLAYKFNTAWSPPVAAIEQLALLFPTVTFTLAFEEEQGWGGEIEFKGDKQTVLQDYESKCRDCDGNDTVDYCDNDCGQICSKCHWLGEADLECVLECEEHKQYATKKFVPDYRWNEIEGKVAVE